MENTLEQEAKWYIIHTYSGRENKVRDDLVNMVENNNLQDFIFEIVVPTEEDIVEKNGKKKTVLRKKYPTYIFVKMIYTKHVWFMVANTQGVTGFLGPQGRPLALTVEEVRRLRLEKVEMSDLHVEIGDNVKIISGALENFIGSVEEINLEQQKIRVRVSLFGRDTPVEVDFMQVEKI